MVRALISKKVSSLVRNSLEPTRRDHFNVKERDLSAWQSSPTCAVFRKTSVVMSDSMLKRSKVLNIKTGEVYPDSNRISKSAWLEEEENAVVARVNRRVEHMTSLTTSAAKYLQVLNYGIGGHFLPHHDFTRFKETNATSYLETGERIATVLFYMSDVAQGGATVFPYLELSLWPVKGTAVFWYNLHPSGEEDLSTLHAGCPVLAGFKWGSVGIIIVINMTEKSLPDANNSLNFLKTTPLCNFSYELRCKLKDNRPEPNLSIKEAGKNRIRTFQFSWYEIFPWLTLYAEKILCFAMFV